MDEKEKEREAERPEPVFFQRPTTVTANHACMSDLLAQCIAADAETTSRHTITHHVACPVYSLLSSRHSIEK